MTTLNEVMDRLPKKRREKIEARAAELIAEEMSLQDLRKAHKLTQKSVAARLGIGQDGVSRLENRADLMLSTLSGYVEAMGGQLLLVAEFPNRAPVGLTGLAAIHSADTVEPGGAVKKPATKKKLTVKRKAGSNTVSARKSGTAARQLRTATGTSA